MSKLSAPNLDLTSFGSTIMIVRLSMPTSLHASVIESHRRTGFFEDVRVGDCGHHQRNAQATHQAVPLVTFSHVMRSQRRLRGHLASPFAYKSRKSSRRYYTWFHVFLTFTQDGRVRLDVFNFDPNNIGSGRKYNWYESVLEGGSPQNYSPPNDSLFGTATKELAADWNLQATQFDLLTTSFPSSWFANLPGGAYTSPALNRVSIFNEPLGQGRAADLLQPANDPADQRLCCAAGRGTVDGLGCERWQPGRQLSLPVQLWQVSDTTQRADRHRGKDIHSLWNIDLSV